MCHISINHRVNHVHPIKRFNVHMRMMGCNKLSIITKGQKSIVQNNDYYCYAECIQYACMHLCMCESRTEKEQHGSKCCQLLYLIKTCIQIRSFSFEYIANSTLFQFLVRIFVIELSTQNRRCAAIRVPYKINFWCMYGALDK